MAPKRKEAPVTGQLLIPVAEFKKTRDSVISSLHDLQNGLVNVQHGITSLLDSYRKHCHTVLGYEEGEAAPYSNDISALGAAASAASVLEAGQKAIEEVTQGLGDKAGDASKSKKRKREKKERDPNAPKKPLTAAFLYHQHARPIVKADLEAALPPGGQIEKNAVQIEVNKRWNELSEEEKEQWKASYRNSMEEYKTALAAYVANKGIKDAELIEEDDASDEAEPEIEAEVGVADSDVSSEDEDEAPAAKAPSPPAKTPRKRQKTTPAVNGNSIPVSIAPANTASTPVPLPTSRTAPQAAAPASNAVAETPAKKDKKKKDKAAPQPIAPAPATSPDEPSPEETGGKKKTKSGRSTRNNETEGDKENAAQEKEKAEKAGKEKKRDRSKRKSEVAST
ncbi:uncharacterized protein ALTATR162_LOCUS7153 [Alternaria atra]|uniref:HMG box domain-containing protein n=1 Tax=Alternaria atra TaxID=119953 RepID=A0A8J2I4J8_9PLEO|nr:uncharacterized protein ALTATR162_LOCUS7153 [Alternaria atra]CAG5170273.1 unnamed protein product [Alternaria atra]